jgi:NaMN:DMB phosphoribosyltransferase
MAAVLALMAALEQRAGRELSPERLAIVTTRWVATDPAADLAGLAAQIGPVPVMAVNLSFATSRNAGLRRYEEFLVKEGVGAGGIALAALLQTGLGPTDLIAVIEEVCDELRVG